MTAPADYEAFARIVQAAYHEVRQGTPRALPQAAQLLRNKLESSGVTLSDAIIAARVCHVLDHWQG